MQCGIHCRTISQIGKIRFGQGTHPPISIDPAKYLLFNGLLHFDSTVSARKNRTFFLQHRGTVGGGIGQGGGSVFVPRGTSSRDYRGYGLCRRKVDFIIRRAWREKVIGV
jgi:hypothetical protein